MPTLASEGPGSRSRVEPELEEAELATLHAILRLAGIEPALGSRRNKQPADQALRQWYAEAQTPGRGGPSMHRLRRLWRSSQPRISGGIVWMDVPDEDGDLLTRFTAVSRGEALLDASAVLRGLDATPAAAVAVVDAIRRVATTCGVPEPAWSRDGELRHLERERRRGLDVAQELEELRAAERREWATHIADHLERARRLAEEGDHVPLYVFELLLGIPEGTARGWMKRARAARRRAR